jgi:hypothetical protein
VDLPQNAGGNRKVSILMMGCESSMHRSAELLVVHMEINTRQMIWDE